ncbi:MAG TPA: serine/threonine-protein kinase [Burkholderiales bacterium]|nr:serine/threonine-protein kinase [Burkholderiales bacterium]
METRVGKYELKKLLGEGASAKVYLALDTYANAEVALKVIDKQVLEDSGTGELTRGQFMNEASLAGKLAHPHIVAILEAVMDEDSGYVAMEYVPGGNLARFTKPEGLLPVEDVIQIGFKSCSALDYAFRQGIVHRDIKPANILVVEGTNIKVADFGAALLKTVESTQDLVVGTPSYMSPEQITGAALTHHSDMYTMGVVLYELLTGQRPFVASSMAALFQKITQEKALAPSAVRASVSSKLDPIILRVLSKRPEDRYPTWAELALDIAQAGRLSVYQRDIPDSDKFGVLRKSELFEQINDAQLWELVHASRWTRLPAANVIIREDEPGQSLYLLAQGQVKVTKRGRLLDVLKAGECFGEMAYIQGDTAPRQATVQSMTDVLIAEFDNAALGRMRAKCQLQFARGLLRTLVERLALANVRISQSG